MTEEAAASLHLRAPCGLSTRLGWLPGRSALRMALMLTRQWLSLEGHCGMAALLRIWSRLASTPSFTLVGYSPSQGSPDSTTQSHRSGECGSPRPPASTSTWPPSPLTHLAQAFCFLAFFPVIWSIWPLPVPTSLGAGPTSQNHRQQHVPSPKTPVLRALPQTKFLNRILPVGAPFLYHSPRC